MTAETSHARSRNVALIGLLLQIAAFVGTFALAMGLYSPAMGSLTWFVLGGVPIWLVALLVYRQHELADLERLDLEALRREKRATGGGEAMFDEQGGLGFMVAEARLQWMRRWLVPGFSLVTAAYLIVFGLWQFQALPGPVGSESWPVYRNVPLTMIVSAIIMLLLFLFARYASGMGRLEQWQLLRGCGSYMLGNAGALLGLIVCLGVFLYAGAQTWEQVLAYILPVVMIVVGAEIGLNFVLDVYRPRSPGVEPRAAFDSRILGLFSEPGGIAASVADAINYQFGFKVSQTWFYQLLQRAFVPLLGAGALVLWLMTTIVVVDPYEHAIVERWGRQLNAAAPLSSGLHLKWPWPIEAAHKYNTGQLHQMIIGHKVDSVEQDRLNLSDEIWQWTDAKHGGKEHYLFLISPAPAIRAANALSGGTEAGELQMLGLAGARDQDVPVNLVRMKVVLQYKIDPDKLGQYTQVTGDPHQALRDVAWREVLQYNAARDLGQLLATEREEAGRELRAAIAQRADDLHLGFRIDYVGLMDVHPEQSVAEAFRKVVASEQEKIAALRQARVRENELLAQVAGDRARAAALAEVLDRMQRADSRITAAEQQLKGVAAEQEQSLRAALDGLRDDYEQLAEAQWHRDLEAQQYRRLVEDFELGLGNSPEDISAAQAALAAAEAAVDAAQTALAAQVSQVRDQSSASEAAFNAALAHAQARAELQFWTGRLERLLVGLEGEAGVKLAQAQAARWEEEMKAAAELTRLRKEISAYQAAPSVYKTRRYLEVLVDGLVKARKYLLAFDPGGRTVRVRVDAKEEARPDLGDTPLTGQQ